MIEEIILISIICILSIGISTILKLRVPNDPDENESYLKL
jgi:hypothetical protein